MERGHALVTLGDRDRAVSVRIIISDCALRHYGLRPSCRRTAARDGLATNNGGTRLRIRLAFSLVLNVMIATIGACGGSQISHVLVILLNSSCEV